MLTRRLFRVCSVWPLLIGALVFAIALATVLALWSAERLLDLSQIVVESRNLSVVVILSGGASILVLSYVYRGRRESTGV
jgi:membrane protease YdiL (CAAX protease family)